MRKMFRLLFWVALVVVVVVGGLRLTALRWWRVPQDAAFLTASISPSVSPGDLILLWRLTKPGFGDLVMCTEPGHPDSVVIGRLVGEGNDDLSISGASITINRVHQVDNGNCTKRVFTQRDPTTGIETEQSCSLEELGGSTHARGDVPSGNPKPADVTTKVPPGMVWLVSDNRLFPFDSRDFGPVPRETCKETVFFRLVSSAGYFDAANRNQYIP
jgi:signal peptidase I